MLLKCGYINSTKIPEYTTAGTTYTVASITAKALHNPILEFTCNITDIGFMGAVDFQVYRLCSNNFRLPVGPAWTFSRLPADINSPGDNGSSNFSFFVRDCYTCTDKFCTYIVAATVVDGLRTIVITDVAAPSTTTVTASDNSIMIQISVTGKITVYYVDNAVINQVGNTVTITNAGIDGHIEVYSSNGSFGMIWTIPITFIVVVTNVGGNAYFRTSTLGTSVISNAALEVFSE